MSKRSTTGQPRTGSNQPSPVTPEKRGALQPKRLREYKTRHEREAVVQRWVILGTGAAIAVALIVIVLALINDQLIRPGLAVAKVNDKTITVAEFNARARLERALLSEQINQGIAQLASFGLPSDQIAQQISSQAPYSTWLSELNVPDQLGNRVLNDMIDDELVRQKAAELGISVTDEELQTEINEFFGYDPNLGVVDPTATPAPTETPTPVVSPTPSLVPTETLTPSPSPTPELTSTPTLTPVPSSTPSATPNAEERATTYNTTRTDFYNAVRSSAGVSDDVINEYFRMRALRQKVRDAVLTDTTETDTFVNARHILVATQEEAQTAIDAINAGESFAAVAADISTDGSAATGGELGWSQPSRYVAEFADAITDAAVGEILGPIQTQFGFHVIQVTGREERPITADELDVKLNSEFDTYVETLRDDETVSQIEIFDVWADNVPEEPIFIPRGL